MVQGAQTHNSVEAAGHEWQRLSPAPLTSGQRLRNIQTQILPRGAGLSQQSDDGQPLGTPGWTERCHNGVT
jgi:hypothetical protein